MERWSNKETPRAGEWRDSCKERWTGRNGENSKYLFALFSILWTEIHANHDANQSFPKKNLVCGRTFYPFGCVRFVCVSSFIHSFRLPIYMVVHNWNMATNGESERVRKTALCRGRTWVFMLELSRAREYLKTLVQKAKKTMNISCD